MQLEYVISIYDFRMVCPPQWLNLERCKTELFRLDQGITVRLYIPAKWTNQNALFFIESDQFTDDRDLINCPWEKSKTEWISISDYFVDFTPNFFGASETAKMSHFYLFIDDKCIHSRKHYWIIQVGLSDLINA